MKYFVKIKKDFKRNNLAFNSYGDHFSFVLLLCEKNVFLSFFKTIPTKVSMNATQQTTFPTIWFLFEVLDKSGQNNETDLNL